MILAERDWVTGTALMKDWLSSMFLDCWERECWVLFFAPGGMLVVVVVVVVVVVAAAVVVPGPLSVGLVVVLGRKSFLSTGSVGFGVASEFVGFIFEFLSGK
jgi:hypothetical protein